MGNREYLGEFEQVALLALLQLGDSGYGLAIRREILQRTRRSVSLGALYSTLNRLEGKGHVTSWLGEATPQRGGKAKRYFRIEPAGVQSLHRSQQMLDLMRAGLAWEPLGEK